MRQTFDLKAIINDSTWKLNLSKKKDANEDDIFENISNRLLIGLLIQDL